MFQTFTGNSRRPRQVNLSGRNPNPFASSSPGSKEALANAHQERQRRQQARDEQHAALVAQRIWRGSRSRGYTKQKWREAWDEREEYHLEPSNTSGYEFFVAKSYRGAYTSADECLEQLRLLLQFANTHQHEDVRRSLWFAQRLLVNVEEKSFIFLGDEWRLPLVRLERLTLHALELINLCQYRKMAFSILLKLLEFLSTSIPEDTARNAVLYFGVLSSVTSTICADPYRGQTGSLRSSEGEDVLLATVLAPLRSPAAKRSPENLGLYQTFVTQYLVTPNLSQYQNLLLGLAQGLDYNLVVSALADLFHHTPLENVGSLNGVNGTEKRFWILAHLIYLDRYRRQPPQPPAQTPNPGFIVVVSILLGSVADIARLWVDNANPPANPPTGYRVLPSRMTIFHEDSRGPMLQPFIRSQIISLIDQQSISGLLSETGLLSSAPNRDQTAKVLASYALILLRVFPRRGLDIRTWLLGATLTSNGDVTGSSSRLSAIKYFWNATRATSIYEATVRNHRSAIQFLKPHAAAKTSTSNSTTPANERDLEWKVILLFLELYISVLRVMDDEEFLSGGDIGGRQDLGSSWTRESALPLDEVKNLTIFLKNLAFTMYWYASDISGSSEVDGGSWIGSYFNPTAPPANSSNKDSDAKGDESLIAGVKGMSIDYVKRNVTGLLRMIYERE